MFKKLFGRTVLKKSDTNRFDMFQIGTEGLLSAVEGLVLGSDWNANVQQLLAYLVVIPYYNAYSRICKDENKLFNRSVFVEELEKVSKKSSTPLEGQYRIGWLIQATYLRELEERITPDHELHQRWVALWLHFLNAAPFVNNVLDNNVIWSDEEKSMLKHHPRLAIEAEAPKSVRADAGFRKAKDLLA